MDGRRRTVLMYPVLVAASLLLSMWLVGLAGGVEDGPVSSEQNALRQMAAFVLAGGAAVMVLAFRKGFPMAWDAAAVVAAGAWTWLGFVQPHPEWWMVVPASTLPWLLLPVELSPRHRVLLLGMQWLSTAIAVETLTRAPVATTLLAGLGVLHLLLVWMTLPAGRLRWIPLGVAAAMGILGTAITLDFLVTGFTGRRALALVVPLGLLAAAYLLATRGDRLNVGIPVLVRQPVQTQVVRPARPSP